MTAVVALIGVGAYRLDSGFEPVPQAAVSVAVLGAALQERLDVPALHLRMLVDPATSDEMAEFLARAATDADTLLLIYYCGHGYLDSDGHYVLTSTRTTQSTVDYQALAYSKVRRACRSSNAGRKIVIIDSCYSGNALSGLLGDLSGQMPVPGTYVLTSSPATEPSRFRTGEPATAFTGRLVEALTDPTDPPRTLNALVARLRRRLDADDLPMPQVVDNNALGDLPLFREIVKVPVGLGPVAAVPAIGPADGREPAARASPTGTDAAQAQVMAAAASQAPRVTPGPPSRRASTPAVRRTTRRRVALLVGMVVVLVAAVLVPVLADHSGGGAAAAGRRGRILAGSTVIAETSEDGNRRYPGGDVYANITGVSDGRDGERASSGLEARLDAVLRPTGATDGHDVVGIEERMEAGDGRLAVRLPRAYQHRRDDLQPRARLSSRLADGRGAGILHGGDCLARHADR